MIKFRASTTPLREQVESLTQGKDRATSLPSDMTGVDSTPLLHLQTGDTPNEVTFKMVILYEWEVGIRRNFYVSMTSVPVSLAVEM